ncbi:MAG TPA: L,D-transpeptidase family protein [bacterium]|nr:L,D-transpeptidase family protein [bacterium]
MHCLRITIVLGIILGVLKGPLAFAKSQTPHQFFQDAQRQAKIGQWDRSEDLYFKALKSSNVDDRIRAYNGLIELYTRLRLYKKAARTKKKLETEKEFSTHLVPHQTYYYKKYKVVKGDTYIRIAARHKISQKWLQRINKSRMLITGQTILLPKVQDQLVVDKSSKTLTWKRGEAVVKQYPVAVGRKETQTPEGKFVITNKVADPVWYRLGQVYPPDSPDNLLGSRWIGLDHKGYGIHGTRDPQSIGNAASHGCVRMLNEDVEELFSWIPVGAKVIIH